MATERIRGGGGRMFGLLRSIKPGPVLEAPYWLEKRKRLKKDGITEKENLYHKNGKKRLHEGLRNGTDPGKKEERGGIKGRWGSKKGGGFKKWSSVSEEKSARNRRNLHHLISRSPCRREADAKGRPRKKQKHAEEPGSSPQTELDKKRYDRH